MNHIIFYKKAPQVLASLIVMLGLYFFLKFLANNQNVTYDLKNVLDLGFSIGFFILAIPSCALLGEVYEKKNQSNFLHIISNILTVTTSILFFAFIFYSKNENNFGFVQMPQNQSGLFLFILFLSIINSMIYLINHTLQITEFKYQYEWPSIFLFGACGVGLSLGMIQIIQTGLGVAIQYDVPILLSLFIKRLVLVGAIGQVAIYILKKNSFSELISVITFFGCLLLVFGFQSSVIFSNGSELFFILNHFFNLLGLSLVTSALVISILKNLKHQNNMILSTGDWVPYGSVVVSLILILVTYCSVGTFNMTGSQIENYLFAVSTVLVPTLFRRLTYYQQPQKQTVSFHLANVLIWCGLFTVVISLLVLNPFGASVFNYQIASVHSYLGIIGSGLFLIVLSFFISVWDRVIHDLI